MARLEWGPDETRRLAAIREALAQASTATALYMLYERAGATPTCKAWRRCRSWGWASGW